MNASETSIYGIYLKCMHIFFKFTNEFTNEQLLGQAKTRNVSQTDTVFALSACMSGLIVNHNEVVSDP